MYMHYTLLSNSVYIWYFHKELKKKSGKNEDKYLNRILSESRVTIVASVACSEISLARASDVFPYKLKRKVNNAKEGKAQVLPKIKI